MKANLANLASDGKRAEGVIVKAKSKVSPTLIHSWAHEWITWPS